MMSEKFSISNGQKTKGVKQAEKHKIILFDTLQGLLRSETDNVKKNELEKAIKEAMKL